MIYKQKWKKTLTNGSDITLIALSEEKWIGIPSGASFGCTGALFAPQG